ncbi:MAG: SDR family NAD(P)-dependent oxidoreductase [Prolixibacteraceae bacterium]
MSDTKILYTLITGASIGLGKELALECARRKMNLILVSLPGEDIEGLSQEIRTSFQVSVSYQEIDLTKKEQVKELVAWINANFDVNMIINNAGVGGSCMFTESTVEYLDNMIQLNVSAMVLLIRLLLPELKKHAESYILNVSSLAAFSPVPYKTVYPASKAFVHYFSLGLRAELKDTSVNVSVLTPGPILTNSDVKKRINGQSSYIKFSILTPKRIAEIALKKLLKRKSVIIPGFLNRFNAFMIRLVPVNVRIYVGTVIFKRELSRKKPGRTRETSISLN